MELDGFFRLFLYAFSVYVWWSLYNGRVHLPARFPGRDITIVRWKNPLIFWIVWGAYLALWCLSVLKAFPFD